MLALSFTGLQTISPWTSIIEKLRSRAFPRHHLKTDVDLFFDQRLTLKAAKNELGCHCTHRRCFNSHRGELGIDDRREVIITKTTDSNVIGDFDPSSLAIQQRWDSQPIRAEKDCVPARHLRQ